MSKARKPAGGRKPKASIQDYQILRHAPHLKPRMPKLLRTPTGYRIPGKGGRP